MWVRTSIVAAHLAQRHYLGPSSRGVAWQDEHGVAVLARATSRRIPLHWLELTRWCLSGEPNAGSRQWAVIAADIPKTFPDVTTVVSYSDPSVGHSGSLYRACGWLWAPTWHRLRPPPTGNGDWSGTQQSVKDRWVFPLRPDEARERLLAVNDESLQRRMPWASYRDPTVRRGRVVRGTGGGDFQRWKSRDSTEAIDSPH